MFLSELTDNLPGFSSIIGTDIYTRNGTAETEELMGGRLFDFPKPSDLIVDLILQTSSDGDVIMDFFSGSGTFAHAVMKANVKDGGARKFILVQLPEKISEDSEAGKLGYQTICDIAIKRIDNAGESLKGNDSLDIGFKTFRVAGTNIKWNNLSILEDGQYDINNVAYSPDTLDFYPDAKDIDIVYEVILRQKNISLSEQIEMISERTYLYADSFLVCLRDRITNELIDELASLDPLPIKYVFRDSAFGDDIVLKDETFRRLKLLVDKNHSETRNSYVVEFI